MPEIYGNDRDGQNRRAIEAYNRILAGRNPYGSMGQVGQDYLDQDQWSSLPDWLRNQYYQANDDSGLTRYRLMSGLLNDPQGNEFVQIGDLSAAVGEGDNSVVDWDQVRYDPTLGMVTTGGNRRSVQSDAFRNGRLLTQLAMAAMGGYAALAENGLLSGASLGEGALGASGGVAGTAGTAPLGTLGSGTTLAGTGLGGSWGALGTGANLTGTGLIGGTGAALAGTAVPGAAAVGGMGALAGLSPAAINAIATGSGLGAGLGSGIDTTPLTQSPLGQQPPFVEPTSPGLLDGLLDRALANPLQTLGLLQSGYGLISGNRGNDGEGEESGGDKGGAGQPVSFGSQRQPWQPNPFTAQQIQNFRYSGGR